MKKTTKATRHLAAAIVMATAVQAGAAWTKSGSVLLDGSSGWEFNVSGPDDALAVGGVRTVGAASSDVDFRTVEADTSCVLVGIAGRALKKPLTSLAFPDSVVSIGNYMCESQSTLTNVVLGTGLKTIGDGAFSGCTKLKAVTPFLPDSVTSVGASAFYNCPVEGKLALVNPSGATVGAAAFRNTLVADADLSGVTSFGNSIFESQKVLTNLVLHPALATVPGNAFSGCTSLKSVTPYLPDSVTSVGLNAFFNCPVQGMLTVTNAFGSTFGAASFRYSAVTAAHLNVNGSVSQSVLGNCPNLRDVYYHGTPPTSYVNYSFEGIASYRINFRISTKRLPDYASLPGFAVATATEKARADYPGDETTLGTFVPPNSGRHWLTAWAAPGDELPDVTLTVNSDYGAPTPAAGTAVLPNGTAMDFSASSYRDGMTSYVCTGWSGTGDIPATGSGTKVRALLVQDSSITWNWQVDEHEKTWIRSGNVISNALNRWAFTISSATATENLSITGVRTVGFADEVDFRSVEADTGCVIAGIAHHALKAPITALALPDSVTSLGAAVCENQTTLTNVVLGSGVRTIEYYAFVGCSNLRTVSPLLPGSLTDIGSSAFSGCPIEGRLVLTNQGGVTVGSHAFANTRIQDANLSGVTTFIGDAMFENVAALTNLVLGQSVTSLPKWLCKGCSGLRTVTPWLPASVTNVGENAFCDTKVEADLHLENKFGVTLGPRTMDGNQFFNAFINIAGTLPVATFERCSNLGDVWFLDQPPTSFHEHCLYGIPAYRVRFHISRKKVPDPSAIPGFAEPDAADMAREDYQAAFPKPYGTVTIGGKRYWVFNWHSPLDPGPTILLLR